jgi:hypothetical protein
MIWADALCLVSQSLRLESEWKAPAELPFPRVHAIVKTPGDYYVGGLRGLIRGKPGNWKQIDERPVKQMVLANQGIWVLFGDGSLDKIEFKLERLVYDVLLQGVKRPWASCIAAEGKEVLIGGMGGWFERGEVPLETYRKELDNQVITTIGRTGRTIWLGTQRKGLFAYRGGTLNRYGFAAGLSDSWITAAVDHREKLTVGVADGGLSRFEGGKFAHVSSPCQKVRQLVVYQDRLVVGGMEGTWAQNDSGWQQLSNEESTCLTVIDGRLFVGTPLGLQIWRKQP